MNVVTRFAPAPTGRLHVGNIRTADPQLAVGAEAWRPLHPSPRRYRPGALERGVCARAIREDLAWLGLAPDEEHRQSLRFDRYEAALERLREAGRVYPAYETAQELDLKRKVQLARGKPPVYDRAALGARRRGAGAARGGGAAAALALPARS